MRTHVSRREAGSAMLLAAVALLMMAGIGAALFSLSLTERQTTLAASNADAAYHMAEAGIDDAVNKLKAYQASPNLQGADFAVIGVSTYDSKGKLVNKIDGSMQGGSYEVTIEPPYAGLGNYKISSVGSANGEQRGIITWIAAEEEAGLFKYGLFGDVVIDTGGNLDADGWDSSKGPYNPTNTGPGGVMYHNATGHIGSNGDVQISSNVKIFGNATPGPSGKIVGSGYVSGSTKPASEPFPLPDVNYAPTTPIVAMPKTVINGPKEIHVASFVMKSKDKLTINGDVTIYSDGDITVPSSAQVIVNGKLTFYQKEGTITIHGGGQTTTKGGIALPGAKSESFQIFTNSLDVKVNGHAGFYGTVFAPKGHAKLNGNADYFGAIVSKSIQATGTAKFHYDEALGAVKSGKIVFNVKAVEQFVPDKAKSYLLDD